VHFTRDNTRRNEGRDLAKQGQSIVLKAEEGSMPNPCGICGEESGTESSFSTRTSVPHCQYHSTCCIFIHSLLMLHNNSNHNETALLKYSTMPTLINIAVHS
jgi:hypothetical protein